MLDSYGLPLMAFAVVLLLTFMRREEAEPQGAKVVPFPTVQAGVRLVVKPTVPPLPSDPCEAARLRLQALGIDPDRLPDDEPLEVVAKVQYALLAYYDLRRTPCRVRLGDE